MDLRSPKLQRLYEDWHAWRGRRAFPTRADLERVDLRYMDGDLTLVDVFHNPLRFFYRIHAATSAERAGYDLTGKFLDSLPHENLRTTMKGSLSAAVKKRAPHLVCYYNCPVAGIAMGDLEVLVLPFSSNGQVIDMLAYGTHFDVQEAP